jgi:hypothetical protein
MQLIVYSVEQPSIIAVGAQNSPANFVKVLDFGVAGSIVELLRGSWKISVWQTRYHASI